MPETFAIGLLGHGTVGAAFESVPIVLGADGNLWFLEEGNMGGPSFIGRITPTAVPVINEFSVSTLERGWMARGADGGIWFTDSSSDGAPAILRVATSGVQQSAIFPAPAGVFGAGAMFFDGGGTWSMQVDVDGTAGGHRLVLLNSVFQTVRTVLIPQVTTAMTRGSDGNVWIVAGAALGRLNANNTMSPFPTPGFAGGIVGGPDGFLWFTEPNLSRVGRMDPATGSVVNEFTTGAAAVAMASGPLGSVWFMEPSVTAPRLGRITTSGVLTECPIPTSKIQAPGDIVVGPDQNVWFTAISSPGTAVKVFRYRP